jgi:prolipoprotein diacylglyceryltransferase
MFPILQLGPLAMPVAPLTLLAGVWVALWAAEKEALRLGLNPERINTLALVGLIAGLAGARLAYVVRFAAVYAADPLSALSPNPATLSAPEGVVLGFVAMFAYGLWRALPLRPTLDAFAPALAVMAFALAVANLASGDAFGAPARLPWSLFLWDDYRHPTQVYALIAALLALGAWRLSRRALAPGVHFLLTLALLAAATVFIEAFRGDSLLIAGWRFTQLIGLAILAACLFLVPRWHQPSTFRPSDPPTT